MKSRPRPLRTLDTRDLRRIAAAGDGPSGTGKTLTAALLGKSLTVVTEP
jgi:hypothetical protein